MRIETQENKGNEWELNWASQPCSKSRETSNKPKFLVKEVELEEYLVALGTWDSFTWDEVV